MPLAARRARNGYPRGCIGVGPPEFPEAHMRWRGLAVILLLGLVLSLASCATQTVPNVHKPPGFLLGLLHGFISLFSLIGSLFFDTRIYGFPNSGSGYDVGFVLGAAIFYGGIAGLVAGRSRAKASA
jgi:prepilin signal peptidase PulO-like enzyme (type II secretory pathway)